jgi:hypothetical protein
MITRNISGIFNYTSFLLLIQWGSFLIINLYLLSSFHTFLKYFTSKQLLLVIVVKVGQLYGFNSEMILLLS